MSGTEDLTLDFSGKVGDDGGGMAGTKEFDDTIYAVKNLERTVSIPAPAGKTKEVIVASSPNTKKSKRYDHITEEADKLQSDQTYLRAQAIAKNRAFEQRVVALHERIKRWEERCAEETEVREREDASIRVAVSSKLAVLTEDFLTKLYQKYDGIEAQSNENGTVADKFVAWHKEFRHFVDVIVPDIIEQQQGEVTRHLKKARETFDIDNTKLMKRESQIIERFEEHQIRTRNDFEQENKTRLRAQRVLEELIDERNRVFDRCEEVFYAPFMTQIQECKELMEKCVADRKVNDVVTLESMKASMDKIQKVILGNFGGDTSFSRPATGASGKK